MLTHKQKEMLLLIKNYQTLFGCAPTVRELAGMRGGTAGSTHAMLCQLEDRGYIKRGRHATRGIEIVEQVRSTTDGQDKRKHA